MAYDLIDKMIAHERREAEQERKRLIAKLLGTLDEVSRKYPLKRAIIFGSAAKKGRFRKDSDVDIAIDRMDARDYFKLWGELESILERHVDLVELGEVHFREKIEMEGLAWTKQD